VCGDINLEIDGSFSSTALTNQSEPLARIIVVTKHFLDYVITKIIVVFFFFFFPANQPIAGVCLECIATWLKLCFASIIVLKVFG
jgi:uncharacterized protein involved in cysteine biosynthesis